MKRCYKCGIEKEMEAFGNDKKKPDGKQIWCRQCYRDYRIANKEHAKGVRRQYVESHFDEIIAKKHQYYLAHQEEIIQKNGDHRRANRDEICERRRERYLIRVEVFRARCRQWAEAHKGWVRDYNIRYRSENVESIREQRRGHRLENIKVFTKRDREYYQENKERIARQHNEYYHTPRGKMVTLRRGHKRRCIIRGVECSLTAEQWQKIIELQNNRCLWCGKLFTKKNPATRDHIIPVIPYNGPFTMENTQALHRSCNSQKHNKLDKSNIVVWISPLLQEV